MVSSFVVRISLVPSCFRIDCNWDSTIEPYVSDMAPSSKGHFQLGLRAISTDDTRGPQSLPDGVLEPRTSAY